MLSRSTTYRRKLGAEINELGIEVMVPCRPCQKKRLSCKMSSLSERYRNCVSRNYYECTPGDLPPLNFNRLKKEIARLRAQEREAEDDDAAAIEKSRILREEEIKALEQSNLARARLARLRKQKRFLKERQQRMFNEGLSAVEELERLEAIEQMDKELANIPVSGVVGAGVSAEGLLQNAVVGQQTLVASPNEGFPEERLGSQEAAALDELAVSMGLTVARASDGNGVASSGS